MKDNGSNASMRFLWIFLMCKTLSIMLLTVSTCNDKRFYVYIKVCGEPLWYIYKVGACKIRKYKCLLVNPKAGYSV